MVVLPFLCVQHRNAWKGRLGKGSQPIPEERDLLRRDAAAAQAALSARSGQSHLEAERLPNGELFKSLTIANFLFFFSSVMSDIAHLCSSELPFNSCRDHHS